uniref:Nucleoside diphosphate kinase-like domain-containing protein n=1 Tax=Daphnia galeata TaxID=27404 RepID=A0A8J2WCR3_9CRUS|nr:unnamed protein product [Daphnia galeata]
MKNILKITLAILKPDVVKEIRHRILKAGFYVVQSRSVNLSHQQVEDFYSEHAGRFFHQRLVTFMKSGPIHVHILAHPEAIQLWRQIMGPTKSFSTQFEFPDTIRGSYGLTDTRNCTHGSDSFSSALREIKYFFPNFSYEEWSEKHEPLLRKGECIIDYSTFTHKIK